MGSVSLDALARLAAMQRPEESRAGGFGWTWDARAMLEANDADLEALGIHTGKEKPHGSGGRLWELTGCPYSPDHDDSAFRIQYPDGGLHVGCHHERCRHKRIKDHPYLFPRTVAVTGTPPPGPRLTVGGRPVQDVAGSNRSAGAAGPVPAGDHAAETIPPAPMWPAGILPDALEQYAAAQARSIGVPLDMVAVPLLVFAGGVIGNLVRYQVKPTWNVFPTLWAGVIGDPAGKKSPTVDAAQWPVNKLQDTLHADWQARKAEWEADVDDKGKPLGMPPKLEHVFTTDVTVEALTRILSENRGVNIIHDELSGFIGGMNQYKGGKGKDRQSYLSLWAGTTIKADRATGTTLYAPHPVAGLYGGIQPDYAGDLHNRDGARDGMVERFLLYWPEVPHTGWTDDEVDFALVQPVADLYAKLRTFLPPTDADRITVKRHPLAHREWVTWYDANAAAKANTSGLRQGFYGKLDSQLSRIALILHCLHNPDDPRPLISLETMQAAIEVAEFFRGHLDRVLPLIGDRSAGPPVGLEARVLRYLRAPDVQDPDEWVRRGRLLHKLNCPADDLTDALRALKARGVIECRTMESATKPSEQWRIRVHPSSKNSNNPNNSGPNGAAGGDSSNSSNSSNGYASDNVTPLRPTGTEGWVEV